MTRDDYIKLHKQTVEAIKLVEKHGDDKCFIEFSPCGRFWEQIDDPHFDARFYRARLKPTKKLVPWSSLNEVPLTHWFLRDEHIPYFRVEQVDPKDSVLPVCIGDEWVSFEDLFKRYKHAEPRDKHSDLLWLPCGKEVVE